MWFNIQIYPLFVVQNIYLCTINTGTLIQILFSTSPILKRENMYLALTSLNLVVLNIFLIGKNFCFA